MHPPYPTIAESRDRLHRAGWSLGETCVGILWQVDGRNGENVLLAVGGSQAEAWYRACLLARELGMLARMGGERRFQRYPQSQFPNG